jgi:hypothetical protein
MTDTLGSILGADLEDDFSSFDLTEIQDVLANLRNTNAIDIAHAEMLQQQSLRGADILSEMIGKIVKTITHLENKVNTTKNKVMLEYKPSDGRATADTRKSAGESAPEVEALTNRLGRAKGARELLTRKYDILLKAHHQYKELSAGMKKGIVGQGSITPGYE